MIRNHPVIAFFALVCVVAWGLWWGIAAAVPTFEMGHSLPGAWAPVISALFITAWLNGREGVKQLVRRWAKWRVPWPLYAFALFSLGAIGMLAVALDLLMGGAPPSISEMASHIGMDTNDPIELLAVMPVVFLVICFGGPLAEELGWRGFAQERLQQTIGPAWAGVLVGLVWSLWHIPLTRLLPSAYVNLPLAWFLPWVVALGIWQAWLYARSNGSVLLCLLLHAQANLVIGALGFPVLNNRVRTISVCLIGVVAAGLFVGLQKRSVSPATT